MYKRSLTQDNKNILNIALVRQALTRPYSFFQGLKPYDSVLIRFYVSQLWS